MIVRTLESAPDVPRLRVAHLASGDLWAGAEVQLYYLAKALRRSPEIELLVVLLNHGVLEQRLRAAGVCVQVLDEQEISSLSIGHRLTGLLRRFRPDVVHTHRQKENVLGSIAARLVGAASVRTAHGAPEFDFPWWRVDKQLFRWLDWTAGRWLQQRIIAVSQPLAELLGRRFPATSIVVIENGIDPDELRASAAQSQSIPPSVSSRIRVGIVGRLVPVKRVDLFLRIARATLDAAPDAFEFEVIGDGPLDSELKALAAELGLGRFVSFRGFQANVPAYLSRLDALLITSDHEGLPMILLESMALKVPVISHAVGGIPAVLRHGELGTLLTGQEPCHYRDVLLELRQQPQQFRDMAKRAALVIDCHYSAQQNARRFVDLYLQLCERSQ